MVRVTDEAVSELKHIREELGIPDQTLRLVPQPTPMGVAFGLAPDEVREGDQIVESEGSPVLVIDALTSEQLQGVVMDAIDTPDGKRLTLRREETSA